MNPSPDPLSPRQTLQLILLPMLATFLAMRLYLHLVEVRHIYPGGYLLHHLFTGTLLVIPAAFVLAFGTRTRRGAAVTRMALGCGSAMILDEIVYLVATKATDADYVSGLSLGGGVFFMLLAAGVLVLLSRTRR